MRRLLTSLRGFVPTPASPEASLNEEDQEALCSDARLWGSSTTGFFHDALQAASPGEMPGDCGRGDAADTRRVRPRAVSTRASRCGLGGGMVWKRSAWGVSRRIAWPAEFVRYGPAWGSESVCRVEIWGAWGCLTRRRVLSWRVGGGGMVKHVTGSEARCLE